MDTAPDQSQTAKATPVDPILLLDPSELPSLPRRIDIKDLERLKERVADAAAPKQTSHPSAASGNNYTLISGTPSAVGSMSAVGSTSASPVPAMRRLQQIVNDSSAASARSSTQSLESSAGSVATESSVAGSGVWDDAWDESWANEDGDDEEEEEEDEEEEMDGEDMDSLTMGLQTLRVSSGDASGAALVNGKSPRPRRGVRPLTFPIEIILLINDYLDSQHRQQLWMRVCRKTLFAIAPLIWKAPKVTTPYHLAKLVRTLHQTRVYQSLRFFRFVERLDFGSLAISDDDLYDLIRRCRNLKSLTVRTRTISSTPLTQIPTCALNLTDLSLAGCEKVEMSFFVDRLVSVTAADPAESEFVSPLPSIIPPTPTYPALPINTGPLSITSLNLSRTRLTNNDVRRLLTRFTDLSNFRMSACKNITDETLLHVAQLGRSLKALSVAECAVTDQGCGHLVNEGSVAVDSLCELELSKTWIGRRGVEWVLRGMKALTSFTATSCSLLDGRGAAAGSAPRLAYTPSEAMLPNILEEGGARRLIALQIAGQEVNAEALIDLLKKSTAIERLGVCGTIITQGFLQFVSDRDKLMVSCLDLASCLIC
ncbi:hypothetical protein HK101_005557 [Irineochytrium annulatum]|nr:hypothetical protein HK101_005557 [Irineochytrium annulatum]